MHNVADYFLRFSISFVRLATAQVVFCDVCYLCKMTKILLNLVVFAFLFPLSCKNSFRKPAKRHFSTYLYIALFQYAQNFFFLCLDKLGKKLYNIDI